MSPDTSDRTGQSDRMDPRECMELVLERTPGAALVANLGSTSATLADEFDRERNFYLTGAMGLATPIGFGVAVSVDDPVTVFEGDGALLMSLGALATLGRYDPPNLTVVVLDNGVYGTTGGQPTHSGNTDFAAVARGCGVTAWHADSPASFRKAYADAVSSDGAAVVACDVGSYAPESAPPRLYAHPYVKYRMREALTGTEAGVPDDPGT